MGRSLARAVSFEKARTRGAAKWVLLTLIGFLAGGTAGVAGAQPCTSCVKWYADADNNTGGTAANTLNVSISVPSVTECADPMLVAVISVAGSIGPPALKAPALAATTGAIWDKNGDDTSTTNMIAEDGANVFSHLNDSERLHSEIWTLLYPAETTSGTGRVKFTLASGATARMSGGAVVLCGVSGTVNRTTTNNTTIQNRPEMFLPPAAGRMWIDNCSVDGDIAGTVLRTPQQVENWNSSSGVSTEDVRSMSSRVAMTDAFNTFGYTLSSSTFYACSAITFAPAGTTAVGLEGFAAKASRTGVSLTWSAGQEAENLGYRLYREDAGKRVLVTPELIAGSALSYPGSPLEAGYSYGWFDPNGRETSIYWLEDIELGGRETLHGPFRTEPGREEEPVARRRARLVSEIGETESLKAVEVAGQPVMRTVLERPEFRITEENRKKQRSLAAGEAAKVVVNREGWYKLTGADLAQAGVSFLGSDPRTLQLFVDGTEQAIRVDDGGDFSFDSTDSVEFYGVPLDTPWAGTQTYWLVRGSEPGARIAVHGQSVKDGRPVTTSHTAELKERLFYAGGILNGETENLFGKAVTTTPAVVHVGVPSAATNPEGAAVLEVALQGFSEVPHEVQVSLNGAVVGVVPFAGKGWEKASFSLDPAALVGGSAAVSFKQTGNSKAVSAVDFVRITYPRVSRAQNDHLYFSMSSRDVEGPVRISGFSGPAIRVFDVTSPGQVSELLGWVDPTPGADPALGGSGYSIDVAPMFVVWQGPESKRHFLAVADGAVLKPAAVEANRPSRWALDAAGADYIAIAHRSLIPALGELKALREGQGLKVAVVDVEDVYDEFGFGVKSPQAIKDFLRASTEWAVPPRFVLLVGDASQDPRDYLGRGQDLVPTKLVDTKTVETASDDWMTDFDGDGVPDVALGRLPAESRDEAAAMVAKIVRHEKAARGLEKALFVADTAVLSNFAVHNRDLRELLPSSVSVVAADAGDLGDAATRSRILESIAGGVDLVHYSGHGTIDRWRGGLLSVGDVPNLRNGERLPIFTVTNCLTGIFQEPLMKGLGEVLMKTPDVGAVAVWASSGTTDVPGQETLMTGFLKAISEEGDARTLGEAARRAKASVTDPDVRATWILLGDPATRVR